MRTLSRPGFEWPPVERLPAHVRSAIAAQEEGRQLSAADIEALVELTAWAFNGVAPDHPQFEQRFSAWCREATARHARGLAQRSRD
jgi:hypothetical protein